MTFIFWGFIIKLVASVDDTLTRIPVLAALARSWRGRIVFSLGTLIATAVAVAVAIIFSGWIGRLTYADPLIAGLIFGLALLVYFEVFMPSPGEAVETAVRNPRYLFGAGFLVSLATLLDDTIVMVPLFLHHSSSTVFAVIGITLATLLEIVAVVYFSKKLSGISHKKELAAGALAVLGVLVLAGVV